LPKPSTLCNESDKYDTKPIQRNLDLPNTIFSKAAQHLQTKNVITHTALTTIQDALGRDDRAQATEALRDALLDYKDPSVFTPDSTKYPHLVPTTFRPTIFEILTDGWMEEPLRQFVLHGFRNGFDLGYTGTRTPRKARKMKSTREADDIITQSVLEEVRAGLIGVARRGNTHFSDDDCIEAPIISPCFASSKPNWGNQCTPPNSAGAFT
jgi:hypothetical protein